MLPDNRFQQGSIFIFDHCIERTNCLLWPVLPPQKFLICIQLYLSYEIAPSDKNTSPLQFRCPHKAGSTEFCPFVKDTQIIIWQRNLATLGCG